MYLAHFRTLFHEFLNKNPYIVPESESLIILDSKYDMCMNKNGKGTKNNRHITRRVHFAINGESYKTHMSKCFEGGLQLAEIATNNDREYNVNTRIKYIMVRLDN